MSDRDISLQAVINRAVAAGLRNLYTVIPAKVVSYDADTQRADCQILIKQVTEGEGGDREAESWPVVPGVPVQFLGAGGYRITCPISDGTGGNAATTGSLFFSHRSMDKWLTGDGAEVDPEFDHDHALADAIFYPGLMPFGAAWGDVPTDGMSVGKDDGLQMKITSSVITLAETIASAQFVALSNLVNSRLSTIQAIFDAHSHPTAATGPVSVTTTLIGPLASVAASKVKAE